MTMEITGIAVTMEIKIKTKIKTKTRTKAKAVGDGAVLQMAQIQELGAALDVYQD